MLPILGSPAGGESPCDDGSSGGEVVVSTQVDGGGGAEDLRREMIDLRVQLDRERRHRMSLEEHIRTLEAPNSGFPERVKEVSSHPTTVSISVPLLRLLCFTSSILPFGFYLIFLSSSFFSFLPHPYSFRNATKDNMKKIIELWENIYYMYSKVYKATTPKVYI